MKTIKILSLCIILIGIMFVLSSHTKTKIEQPNINIPTTEFNRSIQEAWVQQQVQIELNKILRSYQQSEIQNLSNLQLRYSKGIEVIRLLYEKILSLETLFSGLRTHQNIANMANPHSYPDFQKTRAILEKEVNKKFNFKLPGFLDSNPYVSTAYSLVASVVGSGNSQEKKEEFEKIACIIDFTMRMNADLRIIYNETNFLNDAVIQLKQDCEVLFSDCTEPVDYLTTIGDCRNKDEWKLIQNHLENDIEELKKETTGSEAFAIDQNERVVELDFATKRIADFIIKYSDFINLSTQYYQKFENIISNYENEMICLDHLPREFQNLKGDVNMTLNKFKNTYDLPELEGSRLRDLLYGI